MADGQSAWEAGHHGLLGRLAGALLLISLAVGFIDPASTSTNLFAKLSSQQIVAWAANNGTGISVTGFIDGLQNSLVAIAIVLLVRLVRGTGALATGAYVSAAAFMAIGWVKAGFVWALVDTAAQGGSDAGVVTLFKADHAFTFTDGFCFAIALTCVSGVILFTRILPWPIAWFGFAVALVHFLAIPAQLVLTGTAWGITGPISVVFALAWIVVVALTLLIKPVWESQSRPSQGAA
jgi:hypothetical protein